jgi:branched-subunit amino acid transport protein AzlD
LKNKLLKVIEFIPISAFGFIVSSTGEAGVNWKLAFIAGGCLAVIEKAFLLTKKFPLSRIFLAMDIFLIVGGTGFLLNITFILHIYGSLFQSTPFAVLIAVGIFTTFFSERGFVGIEHKERNRVLRYSIYQLGAAVLAFLVSFAFRGSVLFAWILPFAGMVIISSILTRRLRKNGLNNSNANGVAF